MARLITSSGVVIFEGTITGLPTPSPPAQASYEGHAVTITDGTSAGLTWDVLDAGTDLLDRSVPDVPRFIAAGAYVVAVTVIVTTPLTAGGKATLNLSVAGTGISDDMAAPARQGGLTFPAVVAAGDQLSAGVTNNDGVASRDFLIQTATVVRIA